MTDDARMRELEADYRAGRAAALNDMYTLLTTVAYKQINAISNGNVHIKQLAAEERQQKAHDAATYIIEQYIKRPDFCIKKSATGYLYKRVQWELFHVRKCDKLLKFGDPPKTAAANNLQRRYVVTDKQTGESVTYLALDQLRDRFPKLRIDKLRACIGTGEAYKGYQIQLIEIEG